MARPRTGRVRTPVRSTKSKSGKQKKRSGSKSSPSNSVQGTPDTKPKSDLDDQDDDSRKKLDHLQVINHFIGFCFQRSEKATDLFFNQVYGSYFIRIFNHIYSILNVYCGFFMKVDIFCFCCTVYLSFCHWIASDENHWTLTARFSLQ